MWKPILNVRAQWGSLAALVCSVLLLSSCATGDPANRTEGPQELILTTGFVIDDVDPMSNGFWAPEFGWGELLMRPVVGGEPEPWLLEELTSVDDLTWELTLRPDLKFQNGNALDADALVALMEHQIEERPSLAPLSGTNLEAVDERVVRLTTTVPAPNLPFTLADEGAFVIYDQAAYAEVGEDRAGLIAAKLYTGPYAVDTLDTRAMVMRPNADHWAGTPPLAGVQVKFVEDEEARILAVQKGEADFALYPPTASANSVEGRTDSYWVSGTPKGPTFQFNLNQTRAPFSDKAVRKAVLAAMDYRELAEDVMNGRYRTAKGMYAKEAAYAKVTQVTDLETAAKLLTDAGYAKDSEGRYAMDGQRISFTLLTYPAQPDTATLAVAIQAQLQDFGIGVEIRQVPDLNQAMADPNLEWGAAISGNGTTSFPGDPIKPLQTYFASDGEYNFYGLKDPALDRMIDEVAVTMDSDRRDDLLRLIQQRVADEGHMGFLGERVPGVVVGPEWKNYKVPAANLWVDYSTAPN